MMPYRILVIFCLSISTTAFASVSLTVTATPDATFNRYFNRCGPGITGGDSTYSAAISATEVIWLFSDAFIGRIAPDGTRNSHSSQFIQGNILALQNLASGTLTSFLQQNNGKQNTTITLPNHSNNPYDTQNCPANDYTLMPGLEAMFQPAQCPSAKPCFYWAGGMFAVKKNLHTFLQLMEKNGAGAFDFARHNTAIATLPLNSLASAKPVYTNIINNGVSYGGAVLANDKKYTYIYGMRAESSQNTSCSGNCVHIARIPHGKITDNREWRYWGITSLAPLTTGWTSNASLTFPMSGSQGKTAAPMTQDQLGIAKVSNCGQQLAECYVMIAHEYTGSFTQNIHAWHATQPQGPWTGPLLVYTTPESSQPGHLFTYNAKIHTRFTDASGLLVSYDVNSLAHLTDSLNPFITAASYRPRFIRVKLQWENTGNGQQEDK